MACCFGAGTEYCFAGGDSVLFIEEEIGWLFFGGSRIVVAEEFVDD